MDVSEDLSRLTNSESIDSYQFHGIFNLKAAPIYWSDEYDDCMSNAELKLLDILENSELEDERKNEKMANCERTLEIRQKDYLDTRLHNIYSEKEREYENVFGLRDDPFPMTVQETIDRIKEGRFKLEKDSGENSRYDFFDYVQWCDPKIERDDKGYQEVWERVRKAFHKTKDIIMLSDNATSLKAVYAFQETDFRKA